MFQVLINGDPLINFDDRFEAYEALFKWRELDQTAKLALVQMHDGLITEWLV